MILNLSHFSKDRWILPIQSPPFKQFFAPFSMDINWAVIVGVGEAINEGLVWFGVRINDGGLVW